MSKKVEVPGGVRVNPNAALPGLSDVEAASLSQDMIELCQRCAQAAASLAAEKASDRFSMCVVELGMAMDSDEQREILYSMLEKHYSPIAAQALRQDIEDRLSEQDGEEEDLG